MSDDYDNIDFCPTCNDPSVADSHRRAFERDMLEVLKPVLDWFQSDEQPPRPPMEILRDVVAELQADRRVSLKAMEAVRKFLAACRCVDIHHHGFGPAFDAAQAAKREAEL